MTLWGSLVSCGRLSIGHNAHVYRTGGGSQPARRLPACPTSLQPFHFYVAHPRWHIQLASDASTMSAAWRAASGWANLRACSPMRFS